MRQHTRISILFAAIFGGLFLCLLACSLSALAISFFATGKPAFMGPLLTFACILGGLAGVFYVPLYAGRKLPLTLRILEVVRLEAGCLMAIFLPIALRATVLKAIFTPNALAALQAIFMQAMFPILLIFFIAPCIRWTWEKHLTLRARLNHLRGRPRHMWQTWRRNV